MPKREQQNASSSSGRNESHNPKAQAPGDRLQSRMKEAEDVINLLSTGVNLIPNVTRVEANLEKTIGKFDLTNFPCQHCNAVCCRPRLVVGTIPNEHISRDLHQRLSEQVQCLRKKEPQSPKPARRSGTAHRETVTPLPAPRSLKEAVDPCERVQRRTVRRMPVSQI